MATTPVPLSTPNALPRPRLAAIATLNNARLAGLVLLAVLFLGGACLLYLNLAASVAASSTRLNDLTKERRLLEWQKADRERELAQLTHPDRLEARAQELGFRPPRGVTYVTVAPDVIAALGTKSKAAPNATASSSDTASSSLWDTVKAQFNRWVKKD